MDSNYLFFFRESEENGIFSQWFHYPMDIDGITYNCCEQYMMAMKATLFKDWLTLDKIMMAHSPKEQKHLGRTVANFDEPLWIQFRNLFVFTGNLHKFKNQKEKLIVTGNRIIVEASPYDNVWGIGLNRDKANVTPIEKWPGLNLLGKALMNVREILR